jgi:hypothetical protein
MLEAVLRRIEIGLSQVRILSRLTTANDCCHSRELWSKLSCGEVVNASLERLALPSFVFLIFFLDVI